jgi:hypothetical protein
MNREQKLFAAASLFQDFVDLGSLIKRGTFGNESGDFLRAIVEADVDLRNARFAYEGKAVGEVAQ